MSLDENAEITGGKSEHSVEIVYLVVTETSENVRTLTIEKPHHSISLNN